MSKRKVDVLICTWKNPTLVRSCLTSLRKSFSTDASVKLVLNEVKDQETDESVRILREEFPEVEFTTLPHNAGTLAVDHAIPFVDSEYVILANDDMLFSPGWDARLIEVIEEHGPCTASCSYVEPVDTGNPIVSVDDLGEPDAPGTEEKFLANIADGKYKNVMFNSYCHPIMIKTEDFLKVGGYSANMDRAWFPGYGLDDYFPWRLKQLDERYRFITSDKAFVYHAISRTMKKLSPEVRARSGWDVFQQRTGTSIIEFRNKYAINTPFAG